MLQQRPNNRACNQLRNVIITRNYSKYAEGSVLIEFDNTKVICTASVIKGVPKFLRDSGRGWLTAEYGMLPRATHERIDREAARGKQGGRTIEIQRLIGRALRSMVDFEAIGENTINVDCDVIQADGGTRTAAITGSCVAVVDALRYLEKKLKLSHLPLKQLVAAISVGIHNQQAILDLEYTEDSQAETDMNVIMTEHGKFIELQGTAERDAFSLEELNSLLDLAKIGLQELFNLQRQVLGI